MSKKELVILKEDTSVSKYVTKPFLAVLIHAMTFATLASASHAKFTQEIHCFAPVVLKNLILQ